MLPGNKKKLNILNRLMESAFVSNIGNMEWISNNKKIYLTCTSGNDTTQNSVSKVFIRVWSEVYFIN